MITRTGARQIVELLFPGDSLSIEPASESPGFRIEAAEHLAIRAVRTVAIDALGARSPAISLALAKAKRVQEDAL